MMSRAICKHAVAVSVLLVILSTLAPAPAQAAAWDSGGKTSWSGGLTWISSLWDQLVALVHGGGSGPATGKATGGRSSGRNFAAPCVVSPLEGSGINPDGQPPT
ncbi:MAG TPA: hypothetical protein VMW75_00460 [Thermoanaerobaculia bacterium]|nr:hypothetical protein [Thermoanaerobaculia bacterium]